MKTGKITLILGSMMSSKSSVLLEYIDRAQYANKKSCLVRPKTDTRKYISRKGLNPKDKTWIYQLDTLHEITFDNFDLICIDEGQFIDDIGIDSHNLALQGKNIVISALNGDSNMKPWKNVSELLPFVDDIIKLNAVCVNCGEDNLGTFSAYDGIKNSQIVIGDEQNNYKAYCRSCWELSKTIN